jgi:leader peptidase (prepilin peptidase)/N-methyltransferase
VLSYVILRGRCRKCGAKIPPVHLYAEIIFGLGYGVIGYLIPVCAALQIFLMYIAVTVTGISAISDCTDSQVYTMIIDWACVLVFVLKLYVMIDAQKYEPAVIYTATTAAAIGIMAACAYADKEAHLGYGDYHLILLIFLCTGIQGLFYTVFFGSAAGLVIHSPKLASGRRKQKIPFVPLFYYGYLLTLIF